MWDGKGSHESDIEARLSNGNSFMGNYRPQKVLGLLAPTQYARMTRLSQFSCETQATRDYFWTCGFMFKVCAITCKYLWLCNYRLLNINEIPWIRIGVELFTRPFLPLPFLTPPTRKSLGTKLILSMV